MTSYACRIRTVLPLLFVSIFELRRFAEILVPTSTGLSDGPVTVEEAGSSVTVGGSWIIALIDRKSADGISAHSRR